MGMESSQAQDEQMVPEARWRVDGKQWFDGGENRSQRMEIRR
jgi:hypothetical protein